MAVASSEYVMAAWLRWRRSTVPSLAAVLGCRVEALARFRRDCRGVLGAPGGLVLGGDTSEGVGPVEVQRVALCLVRGAALVELASAVPLHPDLRSTALVLSLEAVLDHALAPDPGPRVVVAEALLVSRAVSELWLRSGLRRCLWW